MNRKYWLVPVAALCLTATAGCTRDDANTAQDDERPAEWQLERIWQDIEVLVRVPSGTYRFEVAGRCALDGQVIYAEGTSNNAEFSVHVSKDAQSGLVVFFSTRDDEWEVMLDPADDTSEIDRKNIFRFSGDVPRNRDESAAEPLEIGIDCTAF